MELVRGKQLLATVMLAAGVIASPALAVSPEAGEPESVPASPCGGLAPGAECAVVPEPFVGPSPESAIYVLEDAAAAFLGPAAGAGTEVRIAIESPGYSDLFTIYFPRGSAHLTLPAGDMVALAAEALRDVTEAEVWISAGPSITGDLAHDRMGGIRALLLQNHVPAPWIHLDDGSLDAILNRPQILASDVEI